MSSGVIVKCDSRVKMSVVYPVIKTGGRDETDNEGNHGVRLKY